MRTKTNRKEEEDKAHIRSNLVSILERLGIETRGQKYRCVISGHEDNNPSASVFLGDDGVQRLRCHVCDKSLDAIDVVRCYCEKYRGVSLSFPQAIEECKKLLAMPLESIPSSKGTQIYPKTSPSDSSPTRKPLSKKKEVDYNLVEAFLEKVGEIDSEGVGAKYLKSRGISIETASEMFVREVKEYRHPKKIQGETFPSLAFTLCDFDRNIKGFVIRDSRKIGEGKHIERVEGQGGFFGAFDLTNRKECFFLTEGEMDALAYREMGYKAVSFGSCNGVGDFLSMLKEMKGQALALPRFLISSDQDSKGEEAKKALTEGLEDLGAVFVYATLPSGMKDANEALMRSRKDFGECAKKDLEAVKVASKETSSKRVTLKTALEELSEMFRDKPQPPLKTGFDNLDDVLGGGFRAALSVLMGEPGTGKTTLALQIADNVAKEGKEVLIFSLEMSRRDLVYRSLSRMSYKMAEEQYRLGVDTENRKNNSLKATYFQDYYHVDDYSLLGDIASESIKAYIEAIGSRVTIVSGVGGVTIGDIEDFLKEFKACKGCYPSLVIIDYIQRIKGEKGLSDKQIVDNSITELCNFSHFYNLPILGICSINRESYGGGSGRGMSLSSAKESGSIEFGASQVLALETYVSEAARKKWKEGNQPNPKDSKSKSQDKPQELTYEGFENGSTSPNGKTQTQIYSKLIQCRALKNRTGSRDKIFFDFKSPYNTFNEVDAAKAKNFEEFYIGTTEQEKALYSEGKTKGKTK